MTVGANTGRAAHYRLRDHFERGLLHHSYDSLDDQLAKLMKYARRMAEHMHAAGKRGSWFKVFANPSSRFMRAYILRRGFLDGWHGLSTALTQANDVRQPYLWLVIPDRLTRESRPVLPPRL